MNYKINLEMEVIIMTNKEKLVRVIDSDINLRNCHNKIIKKIEKDNRMNNNIRIWILIPVCLLIVIGIGYLKYHNDNEFKDVNKFNINDINGNKSELVKLDVDAKIVESNEINTPFNDLVVPNDLIDVNYYIMYVRSNKDSKEYNVVNNIEVVYSSNSNRMINISYSKDYKPLRDYYFNEDSSKISNINNVELKIYKYENTYFTEFTFNNYNYDIETNNISENELKNLLISIIN